MIRTFRVAAALLLLCAGAARAEPAVDWPALHISSPGELATAPTAGCTATRPYRLWSKRTGIWPVIAPPYLTRSVGDVHVLGPGADFLRGHFLSRAGRGAGREPEPHEFVARVAPELAARLLGRYAGQPASVVYRALGKRVGASDVLARSVTQLGSGERTYLRVLEVAVVDGVMLPLSVCYRPFAEQPAVRALDSPKSSYRRGEPIYLVPSPGVSHLETELSAGTVRVRPGARRVLLGTVARPGAFGVQEMRGRRVVRRLMFLVIPDRGAPDRFEILEASRVHVLARGKQAGPLTKFFSELDLATLKRSLGPATLETLKKEAGTIGSGAATLIVVASLASFGAAVVAIVPLGVTVAVSGVFSLLREANRNLRADGRLDASQSDAVTAAFDGVEPILQTAVSLASPGTAAARLTNATLSAAIPLAAQLAESEEAALLFGNLQGASQKYWLLVPKLSRSL